MATAEDEPGLPNELEWTRTLLSRGFLSRTHTYPYGPRSVRSETQDRLRGRGSSSRKTFVPLLSRESKVSGVDEVFAAYANTGASPGTSAPTDVSAAP